MALTATANPKVVRDVQKAVLNMKNPLFVKTSSNRPNLHYTVVPKPRGVATAIIQWINEHHPGSSGIVYSLSRTKCEELAAKLREGGLRADHYHAGMTQGDKDKVSSAWQRDKLQIIVATVSTRHTSLRFRATSGTY